MRHRARHQTSGVGCALPQRVGLRADSKPAIIFTDSAVAIKFVTDSGSLPNRKTRHLRRRVLCIEQAVARNIAVLKFVPGNLNCADLLTKPLGFERHSKNMMGELYNG